jgi:ADP-ribosyl-[dinitrogen reductase] hydrolase
VEQLLERGELDPGELADRLSREHIYGIGRSMRAFIRALRDQGRPWYRAGQDSAGNGALMRISPVLLPHLRTPSPALWNDAAVATMVTPNDPAAIGASVAFTRVLWELLGMGTLPPRGWWLRTFVETMRELEGDHTRYETRTPHLRHRGPAWAFVREQVSAALDWGDGGGAARPNGPWMRPSGDSIFPVSELLDYGTGHATLW